MHPRTRFFGKLVRPRGSAAALGYRMPAEWEPMARIWVTPPHHRETWPNCLGKAQKQFRAFMAAMRPFVEVTTTQTLGIKTNDSWIRDYGPIFVIQNETGPKNSQTPRKAIHDFHFNSWGGKYDVRDLDDVVPQHIARHRDLPLWLHSMVLEGGSIDVNGCGTVMTTQQCLLNKNRNPRRTRAQIEKEIHQALGTRHVLWLPGGIAGDDTDGHVDDVARFVAQDRIVAVRAPRNHPDFAVLEANHRALRQARDQDGRKLTIIDLPVPDPIFSCFPANRFRSAGIHPVPASYANFLFANGAVFVPVFGRKQDDAALRILENALPAHQVVPIRSEFLVIGLGTLHCLSQQEPA